MSSFARLPANDFTSLFRLLDDYDVHRSSVPKGSFPTSSPIRAFQPRFDVREEKEVYKLEGELPGIEQKDIQIEFVDAHTLVIKGRTERESSSSNVPAIEGNQEAGRISDTENQSSSYHKATVEDDNAAEAKSEGDAGADSSSKEVAKSSNNSKKSQEPAFKYWVTERSVGEFHRSFSFPTRVDQDSVKASLKNGILSVIVPKMSAPQSRRIQIE